MSLLKSYNHTIYACFTGYIVQAIVNIFAPLLFVTFQNTYAINIEKITLLITVNFIVQLTVDILSAKLVDKIGYRCAMVCAHLFAATGIAGLGIFPDLLSDPFAGLMLSVVIYAIGGGLLEVCVSPLVEACPTKRKAAAMSLLHSFYCWGSVAVILLSSLFFRFAGIDKWRIAAYIWAIVPVINAIYFSIVPIPDINGGKEPAGIFNLFRNKVFWVLILLMFCAGASELAVSQWASALAEKGLGVSKTIGDIAGPCMFAFLMGVSRVLYAKFSEKIRTDTAILFSGALCAAGYLMIALAKNPIVALAGCGVCGFAVGILWPGTFSMGTSTIKSGGTAMFAFLALAGDLGCSMGPTLVGMVSGAMNDNLQYGIAAAIVFPLLMTCGIFLYKIMVRKDKNDILRKCADDRFEDAQSVGSENKENIEKQSD